MLHNIISDASRRKPRYNIDDKNVKHIIDQYHWVLNTSKEILLFVKRVGIPLLQFQAALRGTFSPDDNVVSDDEEWIYISIFRFNYFFMINKNFLFFL